MLINMINSTKKIIFYLIVYLCNTFVELVAIFNVERFLLWFRSMVMALMVSTMTMSMLRFCRVSLILMGV